MKTLTVRDHTQADVAIVGMACLFPGASTLEAYWQNIITNKYLITDPPDDWKAERYHNPETRGNDQTYTKKGGYLGASATFDPLEFGVMPSSLDGGEPDHFLALKVARDALNDAGVNESTIDSERTEVIVGRGTYINRGVANSFQHTVGVEQTIDIIRKCCPDIDTDTVTTIRDNLKSSLPPFNAETVQTLVPNILTGRIANRLNIMGPNYLVDAACASSLIALEHGLRDLRAGTCDLALIGGVNASIPPTMLVIFSQIEALSRKERIVPFDEEADGTLLSEGLGFVVLKRKEDALRDGNRIYAVIKSVGSSSDGRGAGLLAPRMEGEALAIRRAYDYAQIAPETIGLLEAHGTGTTVGDVTEIESLKNVFGTASTWSGKNRCALGTVKSQIGHLIPASGIASIIKIALALHHKVLPPTICSKPNPKLHLEDSPFYINSETRPWIHGDLSSPRRAGINAFGFGGINAHTILEELPESESDTSDYLQTLQEDEVLLFQGENRVALIDELQRVQMYLRENPRVSLQDLSYTLCTRKEFGHCRLSIVSSGIDDVVKKIDSALSRLEDSSCNRIQTKNGIYFFSEPLAPKGKVAFLFPGEGSQYANMLSDLCINFPEVRNIFDRSDQAFYHHPRGYLPSQTIFPLPLDQDIAEQRLWNMDVAAESVFTASISLLEMFKNLNVSPDVLLGHSTGEYSAIMASGMLDLSNSEDYVRFVKGVNSVYSEITEKQEVANGVLLSVGAADDVYLSELLQKWEGHLYLAMDNCPQQKIVCGPEDVIVEVEALLRKRGAIVERLPFSRAYHTPLFKPICEKLYEFFKQLDLNPPTTKMYSCASAGPFPDDLDEIYKLTTSQWARRVRFTEVVRKLYSEGVRIFIEVGPGGKLTSFVDNILRKKPHQAVASNVARRTGLSQLNHCVGMLAAHHVQLSTEILYKHRQPKKLPLFGAELPLEQITQKRTDRAVKIDLTLPRMDLNGVEINITNKGQSDSEEQVAAYPEEKKVDTYQARPGLFDQYLSNMEHFLQCQSDVMNAYFDNRNRVEPELGCKITKSLNVDLPFITEIHSYVPGESIECLCHLNPNKELFLQDHVLGGTVSTNDAGITALPILPLTFSMEVLAEAASLLQPGKKISGMREVRGYHWIGLDRGKVDLIVKAEVVSSSGGEVKVEMFDAKGFDQPDRQPLPMVEGMMIFSEKSKEPPLAQRVNLQNTRPSKWLNRNLYDGFMFHGPTLQGVIKMGNCGDNGATAELQGTALSKLLDSPVVPEFLVEPVVLDAAGQVIAYWTSDYLERAFHIFPFRLEELHIFGSPLKEQEAVSCATEINLVDDTMIRSDIDLIDSTGRVRMKLNGWWDKRFDQPDRFYGLRKDPFHNMLSESWPIVEEEAGENITIRVIKRLALDFFLAHDQIWMRVLAHIVLCPTERHYWYSMGGSDNRKLEWLLGRVTVKEAVRTWIEKSSGQKVYSADIEISTVENSRPRIVKVNGISELSDFVISLSHSGGAVIACVAPSSARTTLGIDIEIERKLADDFATSAFTSKELQHIPQNGATPNNEWLLRSWCAMESVSKAFGTGVGPGTGTNSIMGVDQKLGLVHVLIDGGDGSGGISENKHISIKTMKAEGFILAIV